MQFNTNGCDEDVPIPLFTAIAVFLPNAADRSNICVKSSEDNKIHHIIFFVGWT